MIKNKQYDAYFKAVDGQHLSQNFKDLIMSLLAFKPQERPTIAQIRQCAFFNERRYNEERTRSALLAEIHKVITKKSGR